MTGTSPVPKSFWPTTTTEGKSSAIVAAKRTILADRGSKETLEGSAAAHEPDPELEIKYPKTIGTSRVGTLQQSVARPVAPSIGAAVEAKGLVGIAENELVASFLLIAYSI